MNSHKKAKRVKVIYDHRGHRIKGGAEGKQQSKRGINISPWSEDEGENKNTSVTSPKPPRHMTNNSLNNNFEEESADSRFNTHTFYLYKQKMEALKKNLNTSGVENLSTAGMGIVSGPELIEDAAGSEIEEEIHEMP